MTTFDTRPPLLPEIISLHGKWRGNKAALIFGDEHLSWHELNAATDKLGAALNGDGIQSGHMVGILMENSRQMVEAIIGTMKSGAASVPINLSVPEAAVPVMLRDAGVKFIFASAKQALRLMPYLKENPDVKLITASGQPNDDFETYKSQSPSLPQACIQPDDPLNVIYSSGTTGMPKGILHTHRGRRDWAYDMAIALRYDSSARTLFNLGLYSNISWVGLLATLLAGGTLVVQNGFDSRRTLETIEAMQITNLSMVPIQYQRLLEDPKQQDYDLSSIKAVMSCGSPLHADLKQALFTRMGPVVIELFGLTEGVITTLDPEEAEGRMASVGKPLIGTDIQLIGDTDKPVPAGEDGEIVASGRILMPGYLNKPAETEAATWLDETGKAWLRTGDIGHLDEEGYLYIVDRKKDMILSGGQNIYPQDIEAVLVTHEDIREVAVIGVKSATWGETPLAVIVPEPDTKIDPTTVVTWANALLGKQQRIAAIEIASEIPRNANGKILKRELRRLYKDQEFD